MLAQPALVRRLCPAVNPYQPVGPTLLSNSAADAQANPGQVLQAYRGRVRVARRAPAPRFCQHEISDNSDDLRQLYFLAERWLVQKVWR